MARSPHRARIQWHTWMPWYELSRQIGEAQDVAAQVGASGLGGGALSSAGGILAGTLAGTVLVPGLALPCVIIGGLLTVVTVALGSADGGTLVEAIGVWYDRTPHPALPMPEAPPLVGGQVIDAGARADRARLAATHEEGETDQ